MKAIIINKLDNVAVVVNDVPKGTTVITDSGEIIAKELIKTGHKIALCDIDKGQPIIKYYNRRSQHRNKKRSVGSLS